MKRKVLLIVFMIITIIGSNKLFSQNFGSWVVPPYRINFCNNGPQIFEDLIDPSQAYTFSDAAMKNNGEIYFYIKDRTVYDKNNQIVGELDGPSGDEQLETEIIEVPGQSNFFYIIWGIVFPYGGVLRYTKVDCNGSSPQIIEEHDIIPVFEFASFAITGLHNNKRYIYIVHSEGGIGKIHKCLIDANGISPIGTIITSNDPVLNDYEYFVSINTELNNDENILAWCTYHDLNLQKIFMVYLDANGNFSSSSIVNVNKGIINGIEFSNQSGSNTIYASCEGPLGGIIKVNYQTGEITAITNNGEYGKTFLQAATDGYIYSVSNNGDNLGRINPATNLFTPGVIANLTIKSTIAVDYFIYKLPEDLTVYSTLNLFLNATEESCPDANDGSATAYPVGGTPPYTYLWSPGGETSQTISNLSVGIYTCCITDALGDEVCKNIEVTYPEQLFYYDDIEIISGTQTLTGWNRSFRDGIRIMPGAVITIKNSTLEFGKNAKIIIEKYAQSDGTIFSGGELILDNCTLTNVSPCNSLWNGIEVRGDDGMSQYNCSGIRAQGKLIIKNGTTIENANIGVLLAETDENGNIVKNSGGGIIQISDDGNKNTRSAYFINNKYSIRFYNYYNFKPSSEDCSESIGYVDNLSFIKDSKFELNQNYFENDWYKACVYMSEVNGIKIAGCEFINNFNELHGHGINAYNSGFKVYSLCNSQVVPCPEGDENECIFAYFKKGINLGNCNSNNTISVGNAVFTNNSIGISLSNVPYATILYNDFDIGEYLAEGGECEGEGKSASGFGLYMTNCSGFAIEENEFSKYSGAPQGTYTGILCKDSKTEYDIIYKNTFYNLSYGNYAEGMNRDIPGNDWRGLEYRCNTNNENNVDFEVTTYDPLVSPAMIRGYMGYTNISAGNSFSQQSSVDWHFLNLGTQQIDYWWYSGNALEKPEYYCTFGPNPYPDPCYFTPYEISSENLCPSHYGGGSGGIDGKSVSLTPEQFQETELTYLDALYDYNNIKSLYDNLEDGGNTQVLKSEIETAFPSDMWQLRSDLLGVSPHVSKEVLKTAAEKTDIFPESVLFEILSANPDELKNGDMISFLENKENPLPEYMIDMLKQIAGGVTYKTILKRQLADFHARKSQAALDIVRSILADSILDMGLYRSWLDNLGNIGADKQIVASYVQDGDFTSAQTLLDLIPNIYGLTGDELAQYNDYKLLTEFQISIEQQNRNIFELDTIEIDYLVNIAENSTGTARTVARGILNFGYGYNYCDCLPADSSTIKSSVIGLNKHETDSGLYISAKPNPADTWVAFDYKLPSYIERAVLTITDIEGRVITSFSINTKNGQKIWDARKIESGAYFYALEAGSIRKSGKLIIK